MNRRYSRTEGIEVASRTEGIEVASRTEGIEVASRTEGIEVASPQAENNGGAPASGAHVVLTPLACTCKRAEFKGGASPWSPHVLRH